MEIVGTRVRYAGSHAANPSQWAVEIGETRVGYAGSHAPIRASGDESVSSGVYLTKIYKIISVMRKDITAPTAALQKS